MKKSTDYHDYAFKKGKLIGEFENMYKFSSSKPWHQDKTAFSVFSDIDIAILKQIKIGSVCEVGCGLGYFTGRLFNELRFSGTKPDVTGIDISNTAVLKARKNFPKIRFIAADILNSQSLPRDRFDLLVIKEIIWYVPNNLELLINNNLGLIKKDGYLYVSQSFPNDEMWMGKDVLDSPETLKNILCRRTNAVHYCIEYNKRLYKHGHLHFLGKVKP